MKKLVIKISQVILPIIIFITIWQTLSWLNIINSQFLPSPVLIFKKFLTLLTDNNLLVDTLQSLKRVLIGFGLATIIGVPVGIILGSNKNLNNLFSPLIEIFRPIPPIAWIPLAILWFGLGDTPAYFLVFIGAFFPIFSSSYLGAKSIEVYYKQAAENFEVGKLKYILEVLLPSSLPNIFSGLKTGLGVGWMAVIVAELVGAQSGLGYMIQVNRMTLETPGVIVGMIVIGLVGYSMHILMNKLETIYLPWISFK